MLTDLPRRLESLEVKRYEIIKDPEWKRSFKELAISELGYLAGIVDGEGCFMLSKSENRFYPRFRLWMSGKVPCLLSERYGGTVLGPYQPKGKRKKGYVWLISRKPLLKDFIEAIYPYLKDEKRRLQAVYAMEVLKHDTDNVVELQKIKNKFTILRKIDFITGGNIPL